MTSKMWSLALLLLFFRYTTEVKIIDNGLAPPEIVHTPVSVKPRCVVRAPPLDLIFILDSSGSLRDKFQDEIDIIRRIIKHVTIGPSATRVMLVQFSGTQHLEFNFNKFTDREDLLAALDVLRHVSGITRIGEAFDFTLNLMKNNTNGMRDLTVPKILYLLSDGRTHDYPKDWEMADLVRRSIPNIDIWAYGTGDFVAWPALINYTRDDSKIVTNQNLAQLEPQFDRFRGTEICEKIPSCVKGSDKPLDMALVVDASESVDQLFKEQVEFAIQRVLGNINVNPEAVRLALITYSGTPFTHFKFANREFNNNSQVEAHLRTLRSIKGTTSTQIALEEAYKILTSSDPNTGARQGVPKMALVLTDGHSHRSPQVMAEKMRNEGIIMMAVSITPRPYVDEAELLDIAGDQARVFTPKNLQDFELEFMKYVGFGCPGLDLGPDAKPRIRGAIDVTCNSNSLSLVVRTQRPMQGLMYAQFFHDDENCVQFTDGTSREVSMTFLDGTCGMGKVPSSNRDGYHYNVTVILQFHPLVVTRADQGLDLTCFHQQNLSPQEVDLAAKKVSDSQCSYRLHRYAPDQCVALDAKVGETLHHKWECDAPPQYRYLVHDCYAKSVTESVQILDSDGCQIDHHFLETPNYSRFDTHKDDAYVFQEMSVFKFPGDGNLVFQCKISLCDRETPEAPCNQMLPPKCTATKPVIPVREKRQTGDFPSGKTSRHRRNILPTKPGFHMTLEVETRTLNVLLNERIRPNKDTVRYCDIS